MVTFMVANDGGVYSSLSWLSDDGAGTNVIVLSRLV